MPERLPQYLLVMATVTDLVRMAPLAFFRREIRSVFLRSFLYYVQFAMLGAMTFPAIFFSTNSVLSAVVGTLVAVALAWREKGLLTVALSACGAVFVVEILQRIVKFP